MSGTVSVVQLSADDRLDILELPGRYADALDLRQPEQLVDVFTEDAVWEMAGGPHLVGLDAIKEFMAKPEVHPGAHLMVNVYIASVGIDPENHEMVVHLRSRGVFPVGPSDRKNPTPVFYGRYEDEIVRADRGWRIRRRSYRHGS